MSSLDTTKISKPVPLSEFAAGINVFGTGLRFTACHIGQTRPRSVFKNKWQLGGDLIVIKNIFRWVHFAIFFALGVDVMITIFCDFSQFSAKKLAFFLNTNIMIKFFQNLALF
jgi:hypothetical protein